MSIDFATLMGLEIPEGIVSKIEDASGRVLWMVAPNKPIILEVEKVIVSTSSGGTTYENEEFFALDIYPKKYGTVSVTYGGLTKTITDETGADSPNAQQVFFGTLYGVADSVATPSSGEVVIEGDCVAFAVSSVTKYNKIINSGTSGANILAVKDFGSVSVLQTRTFAYTQDSPNTTIEEMTVPSTVRTIMGGAFNFMDGLKTLRILPGVRYLYGGAGFDLNNLTSLTLPGSLEYCGCKKNIFNSGAVIDMVDPDSPFYGCPSLANIIIDGVGNLYFDGHVLLDTNTGGLRASAPASLSGHYTIPDGVRSIDGHAFAGCSSLTGVTIPSGVNRIRNYAFQNCSGITNIVIPNNVIYVGVGLFQNCTGMTHAVLPDSITSVPGNCFEQCENLTDVVISENTDTIAGSAFRGCTNLQLTSLPSSLNTIGNYAFESCTNLQLTSIPSGVTAIGSYAFESCHGLKFGDNFLNEGLVTIGEYAFDMSTGDLQAHALESITIPSTVTEIGAYAFRGPVYDSTIPTYFCIFKRIVMKPKIPPTLNINSIHAQNPASVFGAITSSMKIIVPKGCLDAYKTANIWSVWGDRFEEES